MIEVDQDDNDLMAEQNSRTDWNDDLQINKRLCNGDNSANNNKWQIIVRQKKNLKKLLSLNFRDLLYKFTALPFLFNNFIDIYLKISMNSEFMIIFLLMHFLWYIFYSRVVIKYKLEIYVKHNLFKIKIKTVK